jgi:hypothetical protein
MGVVADQASLVQSRVEVLVALPRVVVALDAQLGGLLREVLRECAAVGDRLVALGAVRDRLVEHYTLGRLAVGVAPPAEVGRLISEEMRPRTRVGFVTAAASLGRGPVRVGLVCRRVFVAL